MDTTTTLPTSVDHLVVGAGFAGLCTAIELDRAGETDFLVVEKDGGVGGTWRANTYPGAACDVPSQLYSFSFAPNPDWSMSFSPQPEIEAYIQRVADESGVLDRFVFDTRFEDAAWDEGAQRWRVRTSRGEVTARTIISGSGGLSEPKMPDIEGIDSFRGEIFHSARWNHDVDLTGKRVAVIGTGASSIQIVPEVQKVAGHVDVTWDSPLAWVRTRRLAQAGGRDARAVAMRPASGWASSAASGSTWMRMVKRMSPLSGRRRKVCRSTRTKPRATASMSANFDCRWSARTFRWSSDRG